MTSTYMTRVLTDRVSFVDPRNNEVAFSIDGNGFKFPLLPNGIRGITTDGTFAGVITDLLLPTALAVKTYADSKISSSTLDTDGTLTANSDTMLATQKATKTYADTKIASTTLDTDGTLTANSDTKLATQKATKTYADTKIPLSYLDTDTTMIADSNVKVPSQHAVRTWAVPASLLPTSISTDGLDMRVTINTGTSKLRIEDKSVDLQTETSAANYDTFRIHPRTVANNTALVVGQDSNPQKMSIAVHSGTGETGIFSKAGNLVLGSDAGNLGLSTTTGYGVLAPGMFVQPVNVIIDLGAAVGPFNNVVLAQSFTFGQINASVPNTGQSITGFSGGVNGRQVTLVWCTYGGAAKTIKITHDDANSTAANRVLIPGGADKTLAGNPISIVRLMYCTSVNRWIMLDYNL